MTSDLFSSSGMGAPGGLDAGMPGAAEMVALAALEGGMTEGLNGPRGEVTVRADVTPAELERAGAGEAGRALDEVLAAAGVDLDGMSAGQLAALESGDADRVRDALVNPGAETVDVAEVARKREEAAEGRAPGRISIKAMAPADRARMVQALDLIREGMAPGAAFAEMFGSGVPEGLVFEEDGGAEGERGGDEWSDGVMEGWSDGAGARGNGRNRKDGRNGGEARGAEDGGYGGGGVRDPFGEDEAEAEADEGSYGDGESYEEGYAGAGAEGGADEDEAGGEGREDGLGNDDAYDEGDDAGTEGDFDDGDEDGGELGTAEVPELEDRLADLKRRYERARLVYDPGAGDLLEEMQDVKLELREAQRAEGAFVKAQTASHARTMEAFADLIAAPGSGFVDMCEAEIVLAERRGDPLLSCPDWPERIGWRVVEKYFGGGGARSARAAGYERSADVPVPPAPRQRVRIPGSPAGAGFAAGMLSSETAVAEFDRLPPEWQEAALVEIERLARRGGRG